jgi:outer membrane protein TolC
VTSGQNVRRAALALLGLGGLAACSTYRAKPLDPAAIDQALRPAPIESVKLAAAQLKHPLLAPLVIDGTGGFTPDEIAVITVIASPELRALRDQRGVAEAQVVQAGILPNPQLGYSIDNPHGQNSDPTLVAARNFGLTWEVTSLLTHRDLGRAARASAKSLDLSVAWQEWQTAQDARLRALRILSIEQRLPWARSIETQLADTLALTRKGVGLNYRTTADTTTTAAAFSQAQSARFDLEQQLTTERAALNLALGMPAAAIVPLKASSFSAASAAGPLPPAAELLQGLEDRRLDLIALRYGYDSQEATLRAAVLAQFPRIGVNVNRARDTTPVYTRGLGFSVDLPIFDRNQGQIAIGRATRQQLFDEYVARVAEARSQIGQALAAFTVARTQLQTVEALLPESRELVAAYDRALETRNADEFTARDARAALATHEIEQSQLRQQLLELAVALEIASGRPSLTRTLFPGSP